MLLTQGKIAHFYIIVKILISRKWPGTLKNKTNKALYTLLYRIHFLCHVRSFPIVLFSYSMTSYTVETEQ